MASVTSLAPSSQKYIARLMSLDGRTGEGEDGVAEEHGERLARALQHGAAEAPRELPAEAGRGAARGAGQRRLVGREAVLPPRRLPPRLPLRRPRLRQPDRARRQAPDPPQQLKSRCRNLEP